MASKDIVLETADNTLDGALDGVASVGLAVYLILVFYRGNLFPLLSELKKEYGYLEFLLALFIVYRLMKVQSIRPVVASFVFAAVLIAAMNISKLADMSLLKQFADGKVGLFKVIYSTFGGK